MNNDNGGPAFPTDRALQAKGMTLRDYFAAKASDTDVMEVMNKHRNFKDQPIDSIMAGEVWINIESYKITRQQARYIHADAMLKERAK